MEFVKNQWGHDQLVHDGYIFGKYQTRGESTYWICTQYKAGGCRAKCKISGGHVIVTDSHHNHPVNPAAVEVRRRLATMRTEALSTQDLPCQIVARAVATASRSVAANLPAPALLTRAINYNRKIKDHRPVNPTSLADLEIPAKYTLTLNDEPFLLANLGTADRILIFSTDSDLKQLADSSNWHVDGTFKCAPGIFTQLYSIHGVKSSTTLPLVYALLPNKTESTYLRFLQELKSLAAARELELKPQQIMSDFEIAFLNACQKTFPTTQPKGCYFHFSQCIWRKIQETPEIAEKYKVDDEFALELRQLLALSFVPVTDVVASFDILMETPFFTENERLLMPLIHYYEDIWIGRPQRGRRREPMFAHALWNTFTATANEEARTNNSMEGWHRRFSSLIGAHHPSLWKFIDVLKTEQSQTQFRLNQLVAGVPPPAKRRKYKDLDQRLMNSIAKFGTIALTEYLIGIAQNVSFNTD